MTKPVLKYQLVLLLPLVIFFVGKATAQGQVLGVTTDTNESTTAVLSSSTSISTKTSFAQKIEDEVETIPFEIDYQKDPEMEYGEEKILDEGINGSKTTHYLITYWFDEILDREVAGVDIVKPHTQLTAKGTKVIWREINTNIGKIKYWRKLHVWATKYDGNCLGCIGLTYSGTLVRKGVCAVDPKVIPLGTNFYVEGYGMCRSEDIGGAIKGKHIDLGYEDVSKGEWRTGFTDVYLMTSYPTD